METPSGPGYPTTQQAVLEHLQTERLIDKTDSTYTVRRMADLMRRMYICEEKSSGIDLVIEAAEAFQLAAPDFVVGHRRTSVVILVHKPFTA